MGVGGGGEKGSKENFLLNTDSLIRVILKRDTLTQSLSSYQQVIHYQSVMHESVNQNKRQPFIVLDPKSRTLISASAVTSRGREERESRSGGDRQAGRQAGRQRKTMNVH